MKIFNITIGSDPEFPVVDENGAPRSVIGLLPGTKQKPYDLGEGVSCQIDCVGAETCIPPVTTKEDFIKFIRLSQHLTNLELQKKAPNLHLASFSSAHYNAKELRPLSARTFGCDPSWCVYSGEEAYHPTAEEVGTLRSFGFHIHIGYQTDDNIDVLEIGNRIIRAMDICIGLPSILIDNDTERRQLYGAAGDLRFEVLKDNINKVEYRTLGAAMHATDDLIGYVFDQTIKAIDLVNNWKDSYEKMGLLIQFAIDNGDSALCANLCQQFNIALPNSKLAHDRKHISK